MAKIKVSIYELSKSTGIPYETVRKNMKNTQKMTLENAVKISKSLNITLDKLWEVINNETSKK